MGEELPGTADSELDAGKAARACIKLCGVFGDGRGLDEDLGHGINIKRRAVFLRRVSIERGRSVEAGTGLII